MTAWSPPDGSRPPGVRREGSGRPRSERGSVTAETALALPVLVVVLLAALWALAATAAQVRCVDAARGAARAAARGEAPAVVADLGRRLGPDGARVVVVPRGDQVEVRVTAEVRPLGGLPALPPFTVASTAVADVEPT
jgi:hypothetical protein